MIQQSHCWAYILRKPELKETHVPQCLSQHWKQPRCPSTDEWIRKLWYIYTMEYYSAIKKEYIWISSNEVDKTGAYYTEWGNPERKTPIQYQNRSDQVSHSVMSDSLRPHELQHARPPCPSPTPDGIYKDGNENPICETAKETQTYRTVFWTLCERVRVGWFGRMALKSVYYHMWNESPVQVRCMRQGAQGWCTGMTQRDGMGREVEGGFRMGNTYTPVADSCQCMTKPLQHCKIISLQLK